MNHSIITEKIEYDNLFDLQKDVIETIKNIGNHGRLDAVITIDINHLEIEISNLNQDDREVK